MLQNLVRENRTRRPTGRPSCPFSRPGNSELRRHPGRENRCVKPRF